MGNEINESQTVVSANGCAVCGRHVVRKFQLDACAVKACPLKSDSVFFENVKISKGNDTIPARLSECEHKIAALEVQLVGLLDLLK